MPLRKREGYSLAEQDLSNITEFPRSIPTKALNQLKRKQVLPTVKFWGMACDMASIDTKLVALTPAMREGSGFVKFEQLDPIVTLMLRY